ncbi:MAG: hypothetical protein OS112_03245 [Methanoregula sp.]|nr:MAG: hypothetical protein OS112_03245 [Methanoregula sp.]
MPQERGGTPSFLGPSKKKKHVCEYCGRDDFQSRQALSYHRLNTCENRPLDIKPKPTAPSQAAAQDLREPAARTLADVMKQAAFPVLAPPPEAAAADPPKPSTSTPAAAQKPSPGEMVPDHGELREQQRSKAHPALVFILLLLIGILALVILFWDVIEREGKKFLKRFDPPAQEVTEDGGEQQHWIN